MLVNREGKLANVIERYLETVLNVIGAHCFNIIQLFRLYLKEYLPDFIDQGCIIFIKMETSKGKMTFDKIKNLEESSLNDLSHILPQCNHWIHIFEWSFERFPLQDDFINPVPEVLALHQHEAILFNQLVQSLVLNNVFCAAENVIRAFKVLTF